MSYGCCQRPCAPAVDREHGGAHGTQGRPRGPCGRRLQRGAARADPGVDPQGNAIAIWQQFEDGRPDDGSRSNIAINRFDGVVGTWADAVLAEKQPGKAINPRKAPVAVRRCSGGSSPRAAPTASEPCCNQWPTRPANSRSRSSTRWPSVRRRVGRASPDPLNGFPCRCRPGTANLPLSALAADRASAHIGRVSAHSPTTFFRARSVPWGWC